MVLKIIKIFLISTFQNPVHTLWDPMTSIWKKPAKWVFTFKISYTILLVETSTKYGTFLVCYINWDHSDFHIGSEEQIDNCLKLEMSAHYGRPKPTKWEDFFYFFQNKALGKV